MCRAFELFTYAELTEIALYNGGVLGQSIGRPNELQASGRRSDGWGFDSFVIGKEKTTVWILRGKSREQTALIRQGRINSFIAMGMTPQHAEAFAKMQCCCKFRIAPVLAIMLETGEPQNLEGFTDNECSSLARAYRILSQLKIES